MQLLYWAVAVAETTVTIAQFSSPASIWAERVLKILAMGGDLSEVNLSATPTLALGSFLVTCGAILRLQCYHALGRHFTFETGIFKNHQLVTTGPYSIVRHPGYLGAFLAYVGLMLYYASSGSWIMECLIKGSATGRAFGLFYALLMFLVMTGLMWRIPKEDEALRTEFGNEWEDWAANRYALVPGVY
jgi:protein-S-isoprenylcysteine O-methyltransferase Ste14